MMPSIIPIKIAVTPSNVLSAKYVEKTPLFDSPIARMIPTSRSSLYVVIKLVFVLFDG